MLRFHYMLLFLYADPGSGALLWQALVAGFIGLMYYLRRFFRRKS